MRDPIVTVIVPTLAVGDALEKCLDSLERQTFDLFDVVVVDNSGAGRAHVAGSRTRVIVNERNVGFSGAVNQGIRDSHAVYVATLNDDTIADRRWLETLIACAEANPQAGMFACEVRLMGTLLLDSAGMLIAADGSSKQRGHEQPAADFTQARSALFPSASAALYRRNMLDCIGLFDEKFFLYCEDTDLGLRARWAGWDCCYVPGAVVEHFYSHSAGRATPLKAYYIERNRLYTVFKNFPATLFWRVPLASAWRYLWHLIAIFAGEGKGAEYRKSGYSAALLPFLVLRAYVAALGRLSYLLAERRRIRKSRRIGAREFIQLLEKHSISLRRVAWL
ncbi:MAG: glycosyltransferase family 2 protein [Acidobacteriota bacterium]|nr:glycosyltransferase family 2 protein [Acidobacteriota bacterium]